jgi:colicin import membrane protein
MARVGITEDAVFKAVDRLNSEGVAITVQTVRERLGSGSFSTINKHLATWREKKKNTQADLIPDMPREVLSAIDQVWAVAWKTTQEHMEAERKAFDSARREMENERKEMTEEIQRLEQELSESNTLRESLSEKLTASEKQVSDMQLENVRLEERVKNTETRSDELRLQVESLEAKLADLAEKRQAVGRKK